MVGFGSGSEIPCTFGTSASVRIAAFERRSQACQFLTFEGSADEAFPRGIVGVLTLIPGSLAYDFGLQDKGPHLNIPSGQEVIAWNLSVRARHW